MRNEPGWNELPGRDWFLGSGRKCSRASDTQECNKESRHRRPEHQRLAVKIKSLKNIFKIRVKHIFDIIFFINNLKRLTTSHYEYDVIYGQPTEIIPINLCLDWSDVLSDRLDDGRGLVTQNTWKETFRVVSVEGVDVCVAQRVGDDLHTNLAFKGT